MELKEKRILVVGGAGFIGSHLLDQLARYQLRVVDDLSTGNLRNVKSHLDRPNVELRQLDISVPGVARDVVRDIDVVFHLACRNVRHSIGHPRENHDVNATATLDLLRAATEEGVERFVLVSSSEVYGTAREVPMTELHPCYPETVYGASKLAGECYARAFHQTYQLPTIVVRPFNNFGPRSHFEGDSGEVIPRFAVWALNDMPPLIFGDGQQTRDFIYVEDTAYWLTRIAAADELVGRTINLGSGVETSVRELARLIYEEAGRSSIAPSYQPPRPGDVRRHCADATQARELVGFETRVGVREGIRRLLEHLQSLEGSPQQLLTAIGTTNW